MKHLKLYSISLLATLLLLSGCSKKFDEYSLNPNQPVSVPPDLILTGILNSMPVLPDGDAERWSQFTCRNYTYYGDNAYWTGSTDLNYGVLNNIVAMEKEAGRLQNPVNGYTALAKFLRAYFFVNMTLKVGDIPMSEALQKLDNPTPKYDTQKEVFIQSLELLDQANTMLTEIISDKTSFPIAGDIYFANRGMSSNDALKHWQKVVNAFKLRVLVHLSNVADDGDLRVKELFSQVLSNPDQFPIMESLSDNLEVTYNPTYFPYPNNRANYGFDADRLNLSSTWVYFLASRNDLRVMRIAEPARGLGFPDTSFNAFQGAPSGQDLGEMTAGVGDKIYSLYNRKRFYDGFTGENTFIISYPEMCFNIAEAINRGWAEGDAQEWYERGIRADFEFYNIKDGENTIEFLAEDAIGLDKYVSYQYNYSIDNFLSQPSVAYEAGNRGLTKILVQKYLAFARNSGLEGYYQWRRTGIPFFDTGSGTGNSGNIPLRFQYPSNELSTNTANYNAAVQSQYGGNDDINAAMWLLGR